MSNPLIISFYTNDWEYPSYAERMSRECKKLGLEFHIEEKESTRDYIKNTAIKPFFIRDCLQKFQRPVLWVDVDGLMLKAPELPELSTDFAACEYTNKNNLDRDWAVGILWFNYTPGALLLMNEWCANSSEGTDEGAFDRAWKKLQNQVSITELPARYFFVKWRDSMTPPEDTVYCAQLSKFEDKMRRKINGQVKE